MSQPHGRTRDEAVEHAVSLGARVAADHRRPDGSGWVLMADLDGNTALCGARGVGLISRPAR